MHIDGLLEKLSECKIEYKKGEPMSRHTTFKIGGEADAFVKVKTADEIKTVLTLTKEFEIPCFVVGKGSNLLVSDKGISGIVLSLEAMNQIKIDDDTITCGAGASLMSVCVAARDAGLSGLEFAYGIPGAVGGSVYMNAGAYGGEMSQVVVGAYAFDKDGNEHFFSLDDMQFGYRKSVFKNSDLIVSKVIFKLSRGDYDAIKQKMDEFFACRRDKQPLEFPSAGSVFKRPEGHFAGALIEKNNLKGVTVGGARVSEKHAGFIVNTGKASCEDVLSLIKKIQKTVNDADGIMLETEVIFVGRD